MSKYYLKMYRGNKVVYECELSMSWTKLKKQLSDGVLKYMNTNGDFEIINLSNFDKIIISSKDMFYKLLKMEESD